MNDSYFAPLVTLPAIVTHRGEYMTRSGETVRIDRITTMHDFGCCGVYADHTRECWHKSGRILASHETENDIVEILR